MASYMDLSQQRDIRLEGRNLRQGSRPGTPTLGSPASGPLSNAQKALHGISRLAHDVYKDLNKHRCISGGQFEQAYLQERLKLEQAVEANHTLGRTNERLAKEAEYRLQDADTVRRRLHEVNSALKALTSKNQQLEEEKCSMIESHENARTNAADRIISQNKKIEELQGRVKELIDRSCPSPAPSSSSSTGKRSRSDADETDGDDQTDGVEVADARKAERPAKRRSRPKWAKSEYDCISSA